MRRQLLEGILQRINRDQVRARKYRLLGAACLETAGEQMERDVDERMQEVIDQLVPPRQIREARSLATAGISALKRMPSSLDGLSVAAAAACVRTVALIGGEQALRLLGCYSSDARQPVQAQIIQAWRFFDPARYAESVLAEAPLMNGSISIQLVNQLPFLSSLRNLDSVTIDTFRNVELASLEILKEVPFLHSFHARVIPGISLTPLREHASLRSILIQANSGFFQDVDAIGSLPELRSVTLHEARMSDVFSAISGIRDDIRSLSVGGEGQRITSLKGIPPMPNLQDLGFWDLEKIQDISLLQEVPRLETLSISSGPIAGGSLAIRSAAEGLRMINVHENAIVEIEGFRGMANLKRIWVRGDGLSDISAVREIPTLIDLAFVGTSIEDWSPLAELRELRRLDVRNNSSIVDLTCMLSTPGRPIEIWRSPDQELIGVEKAVRKVVVATY